VPGVGHSVLTNDFSGCAIDGLTAFLAAKPIVPCSQRRPDDLLSALLAVFLAAQPYVPADIGKLAPVGLPGLPGRTFDALELTLQQVSSDALLSLSQLASRHGARIPGLRGGYAEMTTKTLALHAVEVIRGVRVSGRIDAQDRGTLTISGPAAAAGTLTVNKQALTGTLGGRALDGRTLKL
jgi:hypothetical protein